MAKLMVYIAVGKRAANKYSTVALTILFAPGIDKICNLESVPLSAAAGVKGRRRSLRAHLKFCRVFAAGQPVAQAAHLPAPRPLPAAWSYAAGLSCIKLRFNF